MKNLVYQSYFFVPQPPVVALQTADGAWHETTATSVQPPQPKIHKAGIGQRVQFGRNAAAAAAPVVWFDINDDVWPNPKAKVHKGGLDHPAFSFPRQQVLLTGDYRWFETSWVYPRRKFNVGGIAQRVQFGKSAAAAAAPAWFATPSFDLRRSAKNGGALSQRILGAFFDPWVTFYFDPIQQLPRRRPVQPLSIGDIYFTAPVTLQTADYRWFETPWVYPRKNYARAAAVMPSVNVEARFQFWYNFGWEVQSVQPPSPEDKLKRGAIFPIVNIERPYVDWKNFGWEFQSWQPPHERSEQKAALLRGDDGNQGRYELWRNFGWGVQPVQPPYGVPVRRGSIFRGDDGTQGTKPVGLQTGDFRWMETPWVYPRTRFERVAAILEGIDGIEGPFSLWRNAGWEVQPWQPPHRAPEIKGASFLRGDDGNAARYEFWRNFGWEIQGWQPPHERSEQKGAILKGDDGTQGTKPFGLQTGDYPWMQTPFVYPRFVFQKAGAFLEGIDGIDARYELWRNCGWDAQLPLLRNARRGVVLKGDDGLFRQVALLTNDYRWMETPWVFPRKAYNKTGILEGIDGIEPPFGFFRNFGWVIQPWQPPHRRPERNAAIVRGIDGNDARYEFFRSFGWPVQPWQPPHPRPERSGVQFGGDRGNYSVFIAPMQTASYPWFATPLFQPPHTWYERHGAILDGIDGIEFIFNFVPPPVPRTKHSRFNRYAGRDERDNTPDDTRDNFARETRRSGVVPRRFNTWRSDR